MKSPRGYVYEKVVGCVVFKYKYSLKEKAFEHFLDSLIVWWKQSNPNKPFEENDLGKLKIMMLLFFTVANSCNPNEDGLLKVFNNFIAIPYGHIEKDIFDLIGYKKGRIGKYLITQRKIQIVL